MSAVDAFVKLQSNKKKAIFCSSVIVSFVSPSNIRISTYYTMDATKPLKQQTPTAVATKTDSQGSSGKSFISYCFEPPLFSLRNKSLAFHYCAIRFHAQGHKGQHLLDSSKFPSNLSECVHTKLVRKNPSFSWHNLRYFPHCLPRSSSSHPHKHYSSLFCSRNKSVPLCIHFLLLLFSLCLQKTLPHIKNLEKHHSLRKISTYKQFTFSIDLFFHFSSSSMKQHKHSYSHKIEGKKIANGFLHHQYARMNPRRTPKILKNLKTFPTNH